jgi:hypothetical protein
MIIAEPRTIALPVSWPGHGRASLDGGHGGGYKRAMMCPFGIATRLCGRITGPARSQAAPG